MIITNDTRTLQEDTTQQLASHKAVRGWAQNWLQFLHKKTQETLCKQIFLTIGSTNFFWYSTVRLGVVRF